MPAATDIAVSLRDVCKSFANGVEALDGFSLDIDAVKAAIDARTKMLSVPVKSPSPCSERNISAIRTNLASWLNQPSGRAAMVANGERPVAPLLIPHS